MWKYTLVFSAFALCSFSIAYGYDWTAFRGEGGASFAPQAKLPAEIGEGKNISWQVDLPGKGPSSPIVVGDRVFVTASGGPKQEWMYVLCFDAQTGQRLWKRQFWATGRPYSHPTSANAAPTPASDGQYLYAFYSSNDLICLDLDGNLKWFRGLTHDYPKAANDVGMASSPVIFNDLVIVQIENQGDSFAAAIDKNTGETVWRIERPASACWASPTIVPGLGKHPDMVILQSRGLVSGVVAETGEKIWEFEGDAHTTASSTYRDGVVYVPFNGVTAFKFKPSGEPEKLWNSSRMNPSGASPIVTDDFIYIRSGNGVVSRHDKSNGDQIWQLRVGNDRVWATPVITATHMYCFDSDGSVHVLQLGDEPSVSSDAKIATEFLGSPAVGTHAGASSAIYVRTNEKLIKIAAE